MRSLMLAALVGIHSCAGVGFQSRIRINVVNAIIEGYGRRIVWYCHLRSFMCLGDEVR